MIVAPDGSGDVTTVQAAVDAVPRDNRSPFVIRIRPGLYREKVRIDQPHVCLEADAGAVLVWGDHATQQGEDGKPRGTFWSATLLVAGNDFRARGLTVVNDAGPGHLVGQAVAAYVDADRASFEECRFLGHQDTLFTGPLPPYPLTAARFGGPLEDRPRTPTRQWYHRCSIEGDIDFIFGSATAVFDQCEIRSLDRGEPVNGWVTAPSTPEGTEAGYVFVNCRLTAEAGVAPRSVYLGRPWRDWARVTYRGCWLGDHIHPDGWDDWGKPAAQDRSFFAEEACVGPGAGTDRVPWSHQLEPGSTRPLAVLAGQDGWNPVEDQALGS